LPITPNLPFDIVARSGWFCLGFDNGGANTQYTLNLFGEYACPAIHFPSTFAEVVGNPDRAIIGYGINDCTHNPIVIEKEEIGFYEENKVGKRIEPFGITYRLKVGLVGQNGTYVHDAIRQIHEWLHTNHIIVIKRHEHTWIEFLYVWWREVISYYR